MSDLFFSYMYENWIALSSLPYPSSNTPSSSWPPVLSASGWAGVDYRVSPVELPVLDWGLRADAMAASMMVTGAVVLKGVLGTLRPVPSSSWDKSMLVLSIPPKAVNK